VTDKVRRLSKGMVAQVHLALMASIDARLMILDEPTLGLDVLSRKAFYEMLIEEWCDGERSVVISTHQVEEVEALLSDVLMLNEGKLVLSISLEDLDRRFTAPTDALQSGRRTRPSLVDLFVALTRKPELNPVTP
jgi:ABC-2 type transport system ATP-binding protein